MLKPLRPENVTYLVVHCSGSRCDREFTVKGLINTGNERFGQPSYHYYVRRNGEIVPILPEDVQGVHATGYNRRSIAVCYEGGYDIHGKSADTRTPEQKASLYQLLKSLRQDYPQARIVGHSELPKQRVSKEHVLYWPSREGSRQSQLPGVNKPCPCFTASTEYSQLQP